MSDLERTTISVRTLVICIFMMASTFGGILVTATVNVINVENMLKDHGVKLDQLADDRQQILELQSEVRALRKSRDDDRPYKWSTPMTIDLMAELQKLNPPLKTPDAQEIHNREIIYTP